MQRKGSKGSERQALNLPRAISPAPTGPNTAVRPLPPRHPSPDVSRQAQTTTTATAAPRDGAPTTAAGGAAQALAARVKSSAQLQARLTKPQIAPGQPGQGVRNKEKVINLPESEAFPSLAVQDTLTGAIAPSDSLFQDLEPIDQQVREGRITVVAIADALDRRKLEKKLQGMGGKWFVKGYTDVLYGHYCDPRTQEALGEVFYFDYGVVAFWGLNKVAEQEILRSILPDCLIMPLQRKNIESDELMYRYVATDKPNIQNDTVTINYRLGADPKAKISIAFAMSQSTKLSVYEEQILDTVEATKDIPEELANSGVVKLSGKQITMQIGEIFLLKSEVNLLSTVLDTPEFFWSEAGDKYEALYNSVVEYLEFDERVEVLNNRFKVLQEMLELARIQHNVAHTAALDWVVIWLIAFDVVCLLLQLAGLVYSGGH